MTLECFKCITDVLAGLLAPLIAITTIFIAYRQWKNSEYKIKVDLFDKRMKVYEIVKSQLIIANKHPNPESEINFIEFYSALSQSKFLFNDDIYRTICEIYEKIQDKINTYERKKDPHESKEMREEVVNSYYETSKWLVSRQSSFEDIFSKYMKLNKI